MYTADARWVPLNRIKALKDKTSPSIAQDLYINATTITFDTTFVITRHVATLVVLHARQVVDHKIILSCKKLHIYTCQKKIYIYIYVKLIYCDYSNKRVEHLDLRITKNLAQ